MAKKAKENEANRQKASDLNNDDPQVYAIKRAGSGWSVSRREFVEFMGAVGAATFAGSESKAGENELSKNTLKTEMGSCGDGFAHTGGIADLVVSPNGKILASGDHGGVIKLWSMPDGGKIKEWKQHERNIAALAISPDSKMLVSASADKTIKFWSLPDGSLIKTLVEKNWCNTICISPDGKLLVSGENTFRNNIHLWSLPDGKLIKTLDGHDNGFITALAISPDGKILASSVGRGGYDSSRVIKLWALPDGEFINDAEPFHDIGKLLFTPDGNNLVSAGNDDAIIICSLPDARPSKRLRGHGHRVSSLAISPDGMLLASGSYDNCIILWSLPGGLMIKKLEGHKDHEDHVDALSICPDGKLMVSGSMDKTIKLWYLPEGELKTCLVDLGATPNTTKLAQYKVSNSKGQSVTYTLPCGSPIPTGAVCTCNCVPGSYVAPSRSGGSGGSGGGSGGQYCTCVPVHYWHPN